MNPLSELKLPDDFSIDKSVRNAGGAMNDVFFCEGEFRNAWVRAYIKVGTHQKSCLANERAVFTELQKTDVPTPSVIWYGKDEHEILILEEVKGHPLSDYLDASRRLCDQDSTLCSVRACGDCLAQVH